MSAPDSDLALVQKALDSLGEHFDSVQVFVTRHDECGAGGTKHVSMGTGNWYARIGQVWEWLIYDDELAREEARKKAEG